MGGMALDLSRIQAICFDVDGTLSDTDDQWLSVIERRLAPLRGLFPGGNVRSFARWAIMCGETPANLVYGLLDRVHLDDEVGRLYSYLSQRRARRGPAPFWIVPGVAELLDRLHKRYPLAVVSARDEASTLAFLDQFKLAGYFRAIATAQTCRYTKPFPDPVLWAAAQMGFPPDRCLMVGDTQVDIRAGKTAGAQTVGVLCGFGQEAELRRTGADLILPHTAALGEVLLPPGPHPFRQGDREKSPENE
jgi:phosphoglycolate phosphatase-like HAD superfamily hydrolase